MRRFARLYAELDATTATSGKVAALRAYFRDAPPEDAAWALAFLLGQGGRRPVSATELRAWAAEAAAIPLWLVEECHHHAGDLAETIALLLPPPAEADQIPLHTAVEVELRALAQGDNDARRAALLAMWNRLDRGERFVWNKLITGGFRVGVARGLVARALAENAGVDPAEMEHRLMGGVEPTPEGWARLHAASGPDQDNGRPYPFYLAHPLEGEPASLGDPAAWQAEWKWDGFRAQLIRRGGRTLLWTRGEELVTDRFPEIAELGDRLPDGTVLDGEILAWGPDGVRPFGELQKRGTLKKVTDKIRARLPVTFLAYDLLEHAGTDARARPLHERRLTLDGIATAAGIRLSEPLPFADWVTLSALRATSRERGVEGLMLKLRSGPYGTGRTKGGWWKWKVEPHTVDAVLLYAQAGHGKRANLYTDYTFAVWRETELVPVAKAYSGLDNAEIAELDRWIRAHTREKFGPVRSVDAVQVFELAFEGINDSPRHKSGVALRFPRIKRWRRDKTPEQADTLATLRALIG